MFTATRIPVVALILALGMGVGCACPFHTKAPVQMAVQPPNIDREVADPYVEIMSDKDVCIGAGTVLNVRGEIVVLTAGHVAQAVQQAGKKAHLRKCDGEGASRQWVADVFKVDFTDTHDLGLLTLKNTTGLVAARYTGKVKLNRGQDCWYIGTPGGLHGFLEKSIISVPLYMSDMKEWARGEEDEARREPTPRTAFNGNGYYGNSGGGLYVVEGGTYTLVGVVVELARPDPRTPCFAVEQTAINKFLGFDD